ncbi:MIF-like protein mif-2 [Pomacea canaliculata]|uniref:MIF-like protein mif-2 n=1 Tax=Pomacea canaliculata TaxID=400727 RepID=UPI000D73C485|nr:MIF-like protein mif-2 [Pomacea canaliculata]XP_025086580.1 MIF-like protein mif-2 [Pomacea canaliculata]
MPVKVAAVLRTNLPSKSIPKDFLNRLSDALVKQFHADIQDVSAEMQADVLMVRGGSCAPMATMQLYHNDDRVDNNSKHDYAKNLAVFLCHQIKVPVDRILVLFHDTRKCT